MGSLEIQTEETKLLAFFRQRVSIYDENCKAFEHSRSDTVEQRVYNVCFTFVSIVYCEGIFYSLVALLSFSAIMGLETCYVAGFQNMVYPRMLLLNLNHKRECTSVCGQYCNTTSLQKYCRILGTQTYDCQESFSPWSLTCSYHRYLLLLNIKALSIVSFVKKHTF
jgi:hypothetical protein